MIESKAMIEKRDRVPWCCEPLRKLVPEGVEVAWGARAIFTDGFVDVVWDRQGFAADSSTDAKHFSALLNDGPLDEARKRAHRLHRDRVLIESSSIIRELYNDGAVTILGTCNSSYGYLYLVAWLVKTGA